MSRAAELCGRGPEQVRLRQIVGQGTAGAGQSILLTGPAGVGKTALVDDLATTTTAPIVRATADQRESHISGGVLDQLHRGRPHAGSRGAAHGRLDEPDTAMAWLHDLGPAVLIAEDLHWADRRSLEVLLYLARRLERLPIALVLTARPWPRAALAKCLWAVDSGAVLLLDVPPLTRTDTIALALQLVPDADGHTLDGIWGMSRGNPRLVREASREEGAAPPASGRIVLSRFTGMDEDQLLVAGVAAVLPEPIHVPDIVEASGISIDQVDATLDGLFHGQLVHEERSGLVFTHPLLRDLLGDDLSPALRRRVHARAHRLARTLGHDEIAADHAVQAELVGDPEAAELLVAMGREALAEGRVATAARYLDAAVRCLAPKVPALLRLTHARVLLAVGRTNDAAAACRLVLRDQLEPETEVEANTLLGRALYLVGAADRGEEHLRRAVDVGLSQRPDLAVQPLLDQALAAWLTDGPGRALPLARHARELAEHGPTPLRERAGATWGYLALETGDPAGLDGTEPLRHYLEDPSGLDPLELAWPFAAIFHLGMTSNYTEHHHDADQAFRVARAIGVRAGMPAALATVAIYVANLAIRTGDLATARLEAERACQLAETIPGSLAYAELLLAEVLTWQGSFDEAQRHTDLAAPAIAGNWFGTVWLGHIEGMRALWRGDVSATDWFASAEAGTRAAGIREPCHIHWGIHAVEAHLAADRVDRAEGLVAWLEDCASRLPCHWPRLASASGRARLAWHRGDLEAAERDLRLVLDVHERAGLPLHRIEALTTAGTFLRRHGETAEARGLLEEAAGSAARLGAGWLHELAVDELRLATGRRAVDHTTSLTPGERRVAGLAANGQSNPEIARALRLTVNTVETHLKHAFAKLGISSRRQLRDHLADDGKAAPGTRANGR